MNDRELRQDVLDELDFVPIVNAKNIGVAVSSGVVTLTGHVRTHAEKSAAERAVRRVEGVRAIVEEIEVVSADHVPPTDDELAQRALNVLHWDTSVPNEQIQLMVRNGMVTLSGEVPWQCQRTAAEDAVSRLSGVTAVLNNILITPQARGGNIQKVIEEALRRNVGVDAKGIRVSVRDGNTVVLEGTVRSLAERKAVEDTAWCALGVRSVEDRLTLSG